MLKAQAEAGGQQACMARSFAASDKPSRKPTKHIGLLGRLDLKRVLVQGVGCSMPKKLHTPAA